MQTTSYTVVDLLDDSFRVEPAALKAVRAFARAKPWRGVTSERAAKFAAAHEALCAAYQLPPTTLKIVHGRGYDWDAESRVLTLGNWLSVVTYLHGFAHVRGFDAMGRFRWSINLFRKCFPRSFAGARQVGLLLMR